MEKVKITDKVVILEELRQEYTKNQLELVVDKWNEGWSYKDIAHYLDINDHECLMVLIHLDSEKRLLGREGGIMGSVNNDEYSYDESNRLGYNELLHFRQAKGWTDEERSYLCKYYKAEGRSSISLALGRTEKSVSQQMLHLKKSELFDYYKNLEVE